MATLLQVSSLLLLLSPAMAGCTYPRYRYTLPGSRRWPTERAWSRLKGAVEGPVAVRGEEGYNLTDLYANPQVNRRGNLQQPAAIAEPESAGDVQAIMKFSRRHGLRVSVFNTGHNNDMRNTADNSVVIFMRRMKSVEVDVDAKTATLGGGCSFGPMSHAIEAASNGSLVAVTGSGASVGLWGWSVAGGAGLLSGLYGLGADQILEATVVTGAGDIVHATMDNEHKELLRAIKGGAGPSFGVGVSLTIRLHPKPTSVQAFLGVYQLTNTTVEAYANVTAAENANAASAFFVFNPAVAFVASFCVGDDCDEFFAAVQAMPACIPTSPGQCTVFPFTQFPFDYFALFETADSLPMEKQEYVFSGVQTEDLKTSVYEFVNFMQTEEAVTMEKNCYLETHIGGAVKTQDPTGELTSVAPAFRKADAYMMCIAIFDRDLPLDQQNLAVDVVHDFEDRALAALNPDLERWVYWNDAGHRVENWQARYWGGEERYNELLAVKRKYDPANFLTCYHCVGWSFDAAVDPILCPATNCSCSNNPTGECSAFDDSAYDW